MSTKSELVINSISILGTGWLGFPLAKHLVSLGYSVKGSTRTTESFAKLAEQQIEPHTVDLSNRQQAYQAFLNSEILIVNIPYKVVDDFKALIADIEKSSIDKVLFVSSTSVYRGNGETPVTEDDPNNLQPCPLLEIENLFRHNSHFETTVVRFAGLFGDNRNPARFFRNGKTVKNPDVGVNLIHGEDCINILTLILEKGVWNTTLNGCADTHPSKRDFYTYAAKATGVEIPTFSDEAMPSSVKIISNRKVKEVLGYCFVHADLMKITF